MNTERFTYDRALPWNNTVRGDQVLPLINDDASIIRVVAGPGSGKTFGLVHRVHRILHPQGLNATGRDVLVVAFNRVIAKDLETKIQHHLDASGITERPEIQTVHALCLKVIGKQLRLLLPHEREALLYDILTEFPTLARLHNTQKKADQALSDHEARHAKHQELWQAVKRWLLRHKAQLISELPSMLLDKVQAGDVTRGAYKYVIVDEFQDLTPAEQKLFLLLRSTDGQFAALGDPKQSIYRFRGNDRDGLQNLEGLLVGSGERVTDITLPQCERCPRTIVEASNQLMSLYPPPMQAGNSDQANLSVVYWKKPQAEAKGMAAAILANINPSCAVKGLKEG